MEDEQKPGYTGALQSQDVETGAISDIALMPVASNVIWTRQPGESDQAFEAFQLYMEVKTKGKPGGLRLVAERLGKSHQLLSKWSSKHNWPARLRAYQNNQLLLEQREKQNALREISRQWARRRVNIREDGFSAGRLMLERAKQLLALPVAEKEVKQYARDSVTGEIIKDSAGQPVEQVIVYNFQQHPRDARLFAESGLRLARLSADMSTENVQMIRDNVNFEQMTDEELDQYAEELMKVKQQALENGHVPGA